MIRRLRRIVWHFLDDLKDLFMGLIGCFLFWVYFDLLLGMWR